jgi:hypothetical protein
MVKCGSRQEDGWPRNGSDVTPADRLSAAVLLSASSNSEGCRTALNHNPLDLIEGEFVSPAIIERRGAR